MPTLEWIGKDKVINHHLDVPYRVMERKYSYDENGQHDEDNGSENMIIRGDNLEALKALLPKYEGRINCIYIDPPYNTGNEGWVYNDNVNDPKIRKWLGEVVGKEGEDLSRHDKWLCMMYPRLRMLQRLLASDGCLAISIGFHEINNLLAICQEMFSTKQIMPVTVKTSAWQKILCKRYSTKSRMALWKQGENWLESLAHHNPGSAERYARVSVNAAPRFRGNYCKGISQLLCLRTVVGVGSVPNPNSGTLRASAL